MDALEGGQGISIVLAVPVESEHHARGTEADVKAFVPESSSVRLHKKGAQWIADLVGIVGVGDIEAHEDQLFGIH